MARWLSSFKSSLPATALPVFSSSAAFIFGISSRGDSMSPPRSFVSGKYLRISGANLSSLALAPSISSGRTSKVSPASSQHSFFGLIHAVSSARASFSTTGFSPILSLIFSMLFPPCNMRHELLNDSCCRDGSDSRTVKCVCHFYHIVSHNIQIF